MYMLGLFVAPGIITWNHQIQPASEEPRRFVGPSCSSNKIFRRLWRPLGRRRERNWGSWTSSFHKFCLFLLAFVSMLVVARTVQHIVFCCPKTIYQHDLSQAGLLDAWCFPCTNCGRTNVSCGSKCVTQGNVLLTTMGSVRTTPKTILQLWLPAWLLGLFSYFGVQNWQMLDDHLGQRCSLTESGKWSIVTIELGQLGLWYQVEPPVVVSWSAISL